MWIPMSLVRQWLSYKNIDIGWQLILEDTPFACDALNKSVNGEIDNQTSNS